MTAAEKLVQLLAAWEDKVGISDESLEPDFRKLRQDIPMASGSSRVLPIRAARLRRGWILVAMRGKLSNSSML